jgi:hypothetical protein
MRGSFIVDAKSGLLRLRNQARMVVRRTAAANGDLRRGGARPIEPRQYYFDCPSRRAWSMTMGIAPEIPDGFVRMKICCYAYASSAVFFRALIKHCAAMGDDVEWSIITPQAPFYDYFDDLVPAERRLYLYRDFDRVYREQKSSFDWTNSRHVDSIYLTLARDKDGYRRIDKDDCGGRRRSP